MKAVLPTFTLSKMQLEIGKYYANNAIIQDTENSDFDFQLTNVKVGNTESNYLLQTEFVCFALRRGTFIYLQMIIQFQV